MKSNCIAPAARTRLTLATPGLDEIMAAKEGAFDDWDPANVSPLVAYLQHGRLPVHRRDVLRPGRRRQAGPVVGDGRDRRAQRDVDRRRARRGADARQLSPLVAGRRSPAYSVMALISSAIFCEASSLGIAVCIAISFIMSPCTVILPAMNACIPAAGSWSTKIALAVS